MEFQEFQTSEQVNLPLRKVNQSLGKSAKVIHHHLFLMKTFLKLITTNNSSMASR